MPSGVQSCHDWPTPLSCVTGEPLSCQLPAELHVCGWVPPAHWVAPGLHATHAPLRQTDVLPEHAVWLTHALPMHVCGWLPTHCAPEVHATHVPARHAGVLPEHAPPLPSQTPPTHICGCVPAQRTAAVAHPASAAPDEEEVPPDELLPDPLDPLLDEEELDDPLALPLDELLPPLDEGDGPPSP